MALLENDSLKQKIVERLEKALGNGERKFLHQLYQMIKEKDNIVMFDFFAHNYETLLYEMALDPRQRISAAERYGLYDWRYARPSREVPIDYTDDTDFNENNAPPAWDIFDR